MALREFSSVKVGDQLPERIIVSQEQASGDPEGPIIESALAGDALEQLLINSGVGGTAAVS